jgi:hypothetical protein
MANQEHDLSAEERRLREAGSDMEAPWRRWGTYLSERQWGTVREDYSPNGDSWNDFPFDHSHLRAYRWGEDGLLGLTDNQCRLCLAPALWNQRDPILKERLFGLAGPEGNHGEDVKEAFFYLDATPTHSYARALYRYPKAPFPYLALRQENAERDRTNPEIDLEDLGLFDENAFFDLQVEYAKASPGDLLIRYTLTNRSGSPADLHLLPTLWFRNSWAWGRQDAEYPPRPTIRLLDAHTLEADHSTLGKVHLTLAPPQGQDPQWIFTENESHRHILWDEENPTPYVKDAFHRYLISNETEAVNPAQTGTKAAALLALHLEAGKSTEVRLRLIEGSARPSDGIGPNFDEIFARRKKEANEFYQKRIPTALTSEERSLLRQAYAGLLWNKQFYHYVVEDWLDGDPNQPPPPASRHQGRNRDWRHLYNRDILSVPDKWEYPWYAAWDLAFHMMPLSRIDPEFTKEQLLLFLSERYMHPSGQLPAYEFQLSDTNPPVHAWGCSKVHRILASRGEEDLLFLERAFHKLLINFTHWVNRKDLEGNHLFSGGFLGLDNIGVFDRSRPLPTGGYLEQADGTAWMAFYAAKMLEIALTLAERNPAYEDVAAKFFEHFVTICHASNSLGGSGLWDEEDGFYYDLLMLKGKQIPLRVRSMVGLIPLLAVDVLPGECLERFPRLAKRVRWFEKNRPELAEHLSYLERSGTRPRGRLLAMVGKERLTRVLETLLDEDEFLSPFGIRSLSRFHLEHPFEVEVGGATHRVSYVSGESDSALFGGNSNWRGPVWFPVNYLLLDALERYHDFYGDDLKVECPTGSGNFMNLAQVSQEIARRLVSIFQADKDQVRPWHGSKRLFSREEHWEDLQLFNEYFDGDTGRGCGASHQTGWTALITRFVKKRLRKF